MIKASSKAVFAAATIYTASVSGAFAEGLTLQADGTVSYDEVRKTFDLLDAFDVDGFAALLSEDAAVVFGNSPALEGVEAIRAGQEGFFSAIKSMSHNIDAAHIWSKEGSFVVSGDVTYTRHDGSTLTIPFADVFELKGDKISRLDVHFDVAPLFAPNDQ